MTRFGGMGGKWNRRPMNEDDLFEMAVNRALGDRMREDEGLCERVWGALADITWMHTNGDQANYSYRAAGDLVAAISGVGNYMRWYCSAPSGEVDQSIAAALWDEGWWWAPFDESHMDDETTTADMRKGSPFENTLYGVDFSELEKRALAHFVQTITDNHPFKYYSGFASGGIVGATRPEDAWRTARAQIDQLRYKPMILTIPKKRQPWWNKLLNVARRLLRIKPKTITVTVVDFESSPLVRDEFTKLKQREFPR